MFSTFFGLARQASRRLLLPVLLLTGSMAVAQKAPPTTEPHFAGGPDSLRALLGRVQRQASPELHGQLFLKLELTKRGVPGKASYLLPTTAPDLALSRSREAQAVTQKLLDQLPPWQLDPTADPDNKAATTVILPLTFGPDTEPLPLLYSDEKPAFPFSTDTRFSRNLVLNTPQNYIQRQFRYPAEDLRSQVQGTVYLYYEVSETGAVEQRRVVGSLSPTINAEALRSLQTLPNATTPPRQQGRPVRVAYVVPINLRIM